MDHADGVKGLESLRVHHVNRFESFKRVIFGNVQRVYQKMVWVQTRIFELTLLDEKLLSKMDADYLQRPMQK